ncbi:MAG: hypothetical protein GF364_22365 [Candidatus Lokiarchaeota archaeon]|nr:hypothetical protein [Candidatus Lokiarchaeota archaeon]
MGVLSEIKLKDCVTLLGTLCGFTSILFSVYYKAYRGAGAFIMLGIVMDFLDGFVARKMKQINDLGRELDSLSDSMVFGVAPAIMILCAYSGNTWQTGLPVMHISITLFTCFAFIVGAILRLAWFNIDDNEGYTGLVTPLSAVLAIFLHYIDYYWYQIPGTGVLFASFMRFAMPIFMVLIAYLNVTPYLVYGKEIRKKQGSIKMVFPIVTILGVIIIPLGMIPSILDNTAPYICIIVMVLFGVIIYYIVYGFLNYRKLSELEKSPEAMQNNQNTAKGE